MDPHIEELLARADQMLIPADAGEHVGAVKIGHTANEAGKMISDLAAALRSTQERIGAALAVCDKADALLTVRIWPVGANAIRSWSSDTQGGDGPYDTMYIPTKHIRAALQGPDTATEENHV
jgi:hypothetical protein